MTDPRPIGVFDSGVGGLTVLREILRRTPGESTIYFGDNARAPYGVRPDEEVRAFSIESIDALVERDVKAVVVACNTSTAVALGDLRRRYDLPILGVIRPGATSAALASRNRRVGVIGTPATVRSHAYFSAIKDENPAIEVYEHATPTFVPMVEAGLLAGAEVEAGVRDALAPLLGDRDAAGEFIFPLPPSARIDTLLLGCTHYPLLRDAIATVTGEGIAIVDSASATASALAELLSINGLEAPAGAATHLQLTTGDIDAFRSIAERMFGEAFPDVAGAELGQPGIDGRLVSAPRGESRRSRFSGWRADRRWQAGFLLGSAIGAAATVLGRRAERAARRGLVDWGTVERTAIRRADKAPGRLSALELRAAEGAYRELMARIVPRLSEALGTRLPGVVERATVVDRAGWIRANVGTFRQLISRMEDELLDQVVPEGGGLTRATMALANRWVTSQQLGYLLGFMGTRVLGQYDLAMLSAEAEDGRLLFVEENIRNTAHALGIPVAPFRMWIALHETTHAFEFEAHPWLRPYLAERLERQLSLFSGSASTLGRDTLRAIGRALRGESGGEHWMESLMGDEQKRLFRETQAVMSLLEGFSDYVMDEVGNGLVPEVEKISARFHERRQRRSGFERAVLRLTGMDLKMEQYAKGERFVRAVAEARGRPALTRLWDGPETLPTSEEIAEPDRWIARVLA